MEQHERAAGAGGVPNADPVPAVLAVLARGQVTAEALAIAIDEVAAAVGADAITLAVGAAGHATSIVHRGAGPVAPLLAARAGEPSTVTLPGPLVCDVAVVALAGEGAERLVVARRTPFDRDELELLTTVGHALGLSWRLRTAVTAERALVERSRLLERLTRIQRSISHGAPLQDVLDSITTGAAELVGAPIAGIRLLDPRDHGKVVLRSACGVRPEILATIRRAPTGEGAGGRAIAEDRLVVVNDYEHAEQVLSTFAADHLAVAMAAPIHEHGKPVGSLTVASYQPRRQFSESEREALLALAEHASLAVSDAKTVAALREARQAQELFLAMVSHELKTPLTAVMGTLRTVGRYHESLPAERLESMLAAAHDRGRDLARLIDQLLEGARAELSTSPREVDLAVLVAEAIGGFEGQVSVAEPVPSARLRVDVGAVRGVVGTLIENAVAHAPEEAAIVVETALREGQVSVGVRNPGRLPDDFDPEELFLPFRRGPDSRSAGVGLGLYIAARLAASLDGIIDVDTATPGSVAFILRFPIDPD